ncbi:hypothetical protein K438DRAFT_1978024 [Mycena galopus ATCC 62051]|nr:hypothetical protein K438DRAFT_1978024 [Mycena galopus ATCC 62051]
MQVFKSILVAGITVVVVIAAPAVDEPAPAVVPSVGEALHYLPATLPVNLPCDELRC